MLYRFGKAETGINEAIQHRFQAGSKHGFRSFRLFFGFRIEINRNKTIHPPIRQPGIRRRPPDKETVNRGNRDAGKTGMRKKSGHGESQDTRAGRSRTEATGYSPLSGQPGRTEPSEHPGWPEYLNFPGDAGHSGDTNLRDTADPKCRRPCNTRHTRSRIAQVRTRRASGKNGSMNRNRGN